MGLHRHTIFLLLEWITIFVFKIFVIVIIILVFTTILLVIKVVIVFLLFFLFIVVVAIRSMFVVRFVAFSFVMTSSWAFPQIICVKGKGASPLVCASSTMRGTSPMAILGVDGLV